MAYQRRRGAAAGPLPAGEGWVREKRHTPPTPTEHRQHRHPASVHAPAAHRHSGAGRNPGPWRRDGAQAALMRGCRRAGFSLTQPSPAGRGLAACATLTTTHYSRPTSAPAHCHSRPTSAPAHCHSRLTPAPGTPSFPPPYRHSRESGNPHPASFHSFRLPPTVIPAQAGIQNPGGGLALGKVVGNEGLTGASPFREWRGGRCYSGGHCLFEAITGVLDSGLRQNDGGGARNDGGDAAGIMVSGNMNGGLWPTRPGVAQAAALSQRERVG